jgi:subtilisin family serine protease
MIRRSVGAFITSALLIASVVPAGVSAQGPTRPHAALPAALEEAKLAKPKLDKNVAGKGKIALSLDGVHGQVRVFVRLSSAPAAVFSAAGPTAVLSQVRVNRTQQTRLIVRAQKLDKSVRVLGRTDRASNVVALRIDASKLDDLAKDPSVLAVTRIVDYQLALSETVPYIGGTAVQKAGFKGAGIKVGVVDGGIDYTHKAFGGAGTLAAYQAAYGTSNADPKNTTLDGLFPTARVVGGYDFVGESWPGPDPNAPEAEKPDPDPIDFEGHGSHVADIIGGKLGVAPKVKLYALKVCSAVSTACSGVGLLQAVDWAVDPNHNGKTNDHLDILNMSLGSDYGSAFIDDLSLAVDQASRVGVLTVAASGNGGDKPWISGTPAAARTALSVAQTQVPSALAFPLIVDSPPAIAGSYPNTATLDWAPLGSGFSGDVAYVGRGCPAGTVAGQPGPDPYLANPSGKVALIDRGDCAISEKVSRAAHTGAVAVLIGLVTPGDPPTFAIGGGDLFVPSLVITQDLSESIKANIVAPVHVSVSIAVSVPLVGSVVGSSSRGPSIDLNLIKPEIGAPGASVSAIAGSGDGTEAFGGTSGAAPMVTGSAALLFDAYPHRTVSEIKSLLMNTAETTIYNNPANTPGYLAPITRIGGGEVRVNRALKSPAAAWDRYGKSGDLSFGFVDASKPLTTLTRWVRVKNYTNKTIHYAISAKFRYANDRLNGAVKISVPERITLAPHAQRTFKVTLKINGNKLREWTLDSGPAALDARALDTLEYDGYLNFNNTATHKDDKDPLHVAWQVLPRLAANVSAGSTSLVADGVISGGAFDGLPAATTVLTNKGVGTATVGEYSLVATSPRLPAAVRGSNQAVIDLKGVGVQTFPVPADFCGPNPSFVYVIAISNWERETIGSYPGLFEVFLDTDTNGTPDYVVFNAPLSGPGTTGDVRTLTWVQNLVTDDASAFFFADHGTNDSNMTLPLCGDQIGLDASAFFQPMTMDVGAFDGSYSRNQTDSVEGITVLPLGERFFGLFGDTSDPGQGTGDIGPHGTIGLTIADFGTVDTNPGESGVLLILNADRGGARGGSPKGNDALQIQVAGAP